ncbi:MAG: hypothetical protein ACJ735_08025 [Actinomycetes bacterium]
MPLWRENRKLEVDEAAWTLRAQAAGPLLVRLCDARLPQDEVHGLVQEAVSEEAALDGTLTPAGATARTLMWMRACRRSEVLFGASAHVADLSKRAIVATEEDALLAVDAAVNAADFWMAGSVVRIAVGMLQHLASLGERELTAVALLLESVEQRKQLSQPDYKKLRSRLRELLPSDSDVVVDTSLIQPVDAWAAAVLPDLATTTSAPASVNALLRHLLRATGSKPTGKWLSRATTLLDNDSNAEIVHLLVVALADAPPVETTGRWGVLPIVLDERNGDIARGAVWAAISVRAEWVVPALLRISERGIEMSGLIGWMSGDKVPNAAILALGRIGSDEAIAALEGLADRTRHNGFRKRIALALLAAAEAA